ncbi:MAG: GNAT family N-acetyltransferase [bacterium]|nr:GNAT family N-acetyltransferase [bacterium]
MSYLKDLLPIKTPRLTIRILEPSEADIRVAYVTENREHLEYWEPTHSDAYFTREYWKKEIKRMVGDFFMGNSARFAVFLKDKPEGPIVAVCNYTNVMRGVLQACFLGYSTHHRYQGQGVMHEALEATVDFMFDHFGIHRIMANYMPRNERSGRLLRKLGFNVEGFARDYLQIADKWEDHILTARIKE